MLNEDGTTNDIFIRLPERDSRTDSHFMNMAILETELCVAERGRVGIVATLNDRVVATAHNQRPDAVRNKVCEYTDQDKTLPSTLHAEEVLVADCASRGVSLRGTTVYITRTPCQNCAALLAQAGVKKLVYLSMHPHGDGLPVLYESNVEVLSLEGHSNKINYELEAKYL